MPGGTKRFVVPSGPHKGVYEVPEDKALEQAKAFEDAGIPFELENAGESLDFGDEAPDSGGEIEASKKALDETRNPEPIKSAAKPQAGMSANEARATGAVEAGSFGLMDKAAGLGSALFDLINPDQAITRVGKGIGGQPIGETKPSLPPMSPVDLALNMVAPGAGDVMHGLDQMEAAAPQATQAGRQAADQQVEQARAVGASEPWYSDPFMQGELGGAVLTSPPVPGAPAAGTLLERIPQAAKYGGLMGGMHGAAQGAGSAPEGETLQGAATGGVEGSILGALLGPAFEVGLTPIRKLGEATWEGLKHMATPEGRAMQLLELGGGEPVFLARPGEGPWIGNRIRPGDKIKSFFEQSAQSMGEEGASDVAVRQATKELVNAFEEPRAEAVKMVKRLKDDYFISPEAKRKVPTDRLLSEMDDVLSSETKSPEARSRLRSFIYKELARDAAVAEGPGGGGVLRYGEPKMLNAKEADQVLEVLRDYGKISTDTAEPGLPKAAAKLYRMMGDYIENNWGGLNKINREFAGPLLGERDALLKAGGFEPRSTGLSNRRLSDDYEAARGAAGRYPFNAPEREAIHTVSGEKIPGDDPAAFMREAHNVVQEMRKQIGLGKDVDAKAVLNKHPKLLQALRFARAVRSYENLKEGKSIVRGVFNGGNAQTYADIQTVRRTLRHAIAGLKGIQPGGPVGTVAPVKARLDATDEDVDYLEQAFERASQTLRATMIPPMITPNGLEMR